MLEVRAKVAALTALSGKRKDWGVGRAWQWDYLADVRRVTMGININSILKSSNYDAVLTLTCYFHHYPKMDVIIFYCKTKDKS